jgi:anaerobic ribonucleoside-triphosphate reductase activating protein
MNVHAYCVSKVNGPGERFTLWTQGCSKGCKNCFNPETWSFSSNRIMSVREIFNIIKDLDVSGVTITGGDPFEQPEELFDLLLLLEELNLSKGVIVFTGYTIDEINKDFLLRKSLSLIDVLIDGRYIDDQRISSGLRGSENQNIIYFSDKVLPEELEIDQSVEIGLESDCIYVTGFPSISRKFLRSLGVYLK